MGDDNEEPMTPSELAKAKGLSHHCIPTERCGALNVYIAGDLELTHRKDDKDSVCVFLTVHNAGANHNEWLRFANHPAMATIKDHAVFIHVDLLGQEDNAAPLDPEVKWPTIQAIGEDLVNILDTLRVKCVIGLGNGAGANIMMRFAMMHVTRCLGVILVHPTSANASMMETFREKVTQRKASIGLGMSLGNNSGCEVNIKNMSKYVDSFQARDDVTEFLEDKMTSDALLVSGSKSSSVKAMEHMFANCDKTRTSMIKIDDVADVLNEAQVKLANSVLLFVKGLGWLTSVALPNVERKSSRDMAGRRMSMEDYDKPNIRRLSLTNPE